MKKLALLTSAFALGAFAQAEVTVCEEKCPSMSKKACSSTSSTNSTAQFVIANPTQEAMASAKAALGTNASVKDCQTCDKSGLLTVQFNPEKTGSTQIYQELTKNGVNVAGQKVAFKIKGMVCGSCSNRLTATLGKTEGIVNVDKVCHQGGLAEVTFDPKKTDPSKLKAAINETHYKVVESAQKSS